MKLRKVRSRSTSPEGRGVLHKAVDKSFVRGQELRCAKERLGSMTDAHSSTGLVGQLVNVDFPGKIMADSETQKLEVKDFFKRVVEKVDGWGRGGFRQSFRRDIVRV